MPKIGTVTNSFSVPRFHCL